MHYEIVRFEELDSTNSYARLHIDELRHGQVIAADRQSAGRGRLERRWHSGGEGNVSLSIVLKPDGAEASSLPLANLTQYLSVSVSRVLAGSGVSPLIKWPNDVLIGEAKIAGILSEAVTRGSSVQGIILGLGVNLNMTPDELASIDRPAASLNLLLGQAVDRDAFTALLLDEFFHGYEEFCRRGFVSIKEDYERLSVCFGRRATVDLVGRSLEGTVVGLTNEGALLLETSTGEMTLSTGELSWM